MLAEEPLADTVSNVLFGEEVFAFRTQGTSMPTIRRHLASHLPVAPENIIIVGSAKMGFSLNPDSYFRPFGKNSDIDIVVVDTELFDQVWHALLQWHYPRRQLGLEPASAHWAGDRKRDIYWGWLTPHKIRFDGLYFPQALVPIRNLAGQWFGAFQSLSLYPQFNTRTINSRLYRTWDHARVYHIDGLRTLKDSVSRLEGK